MGVILNLFQNLPIELFVVVVILANRQMQVQKAQ